MLVSVAAATQLAYTGKLEIKIALKLLSL